MQSRTTATTRWAPAPCPSTTRPSRTTHRRWAGGSSAGATTENARASGATDTTTITNSTIAFNDGGRARRAGGGLLASEGKISVRNTIVASNTVADPLNGAQKPSNCGGVTSLGSNLETGTDCGFTASGDRQKTDPGFLTGALRFNGGNTETFALSATSPAVDAIASTAAGCAGSDQRDVSRPQGEGCDIGAYELFQPVEGQQFTTVVGQIGGTSATIDWGDGTSASRGTVDSLHQVTGTHSYVEEGIYHAAINWKNGDGVNQRTPFDVKVVDAPLTLDPDRHQRERRRVLQRARWRRSPTPIRATPGSDYSATDQLG